MKIWPRKEKGRWKGWSRYRSSVWEHRHRIFIRCLVALLCGSGLPFNLSVLYLGGIQNFGTSDSGDDVLVKKYCIMNHAKLDGLKQQLSLFPTVYVVQEFRNDLARHVLFEVLCEVALRLWLGLYSSEALRIHLQGGSMAFDDKTQFSSMWCLHRLLEYLLDMAAGFPQCKGSQWSRWRLQYLLWSTLGSHIL